MNNIKNLKDIANEIRILTIQSIGELGVGHIGGSMTLPEVLSVLYFDQMNIDVNSPNKNDRDRFVLSKGHGGPALYSTLALKGFLNREDLKTLNRPNTNLPSHPDMSKTKGVDMTTGSLGQGFSAAIGMALGAKLKQEDLFVYTVIGDGESQEGQIWEGALFAGNSKLNNLIAFTDYNNMQIDGYVSDVNDLSNLEDKWKSFKWNVLVIDGHDVLAIREAIEKCKLEKEYPSMIILKTIKGKGCYFCENEISSHNMAITEEMWKKAVLLLKDRSKDYD